MKMEIDFKDAKTWLALAGALLVLAFAGSVAIVKIGVSLEAGWMSDLVKGPRLQKVELGRCTQLFDRDTGQIVKESCRSVEEDAVVHTLAENLKKLSHELNQAKTDLEQSRNTVSGLRKQAEGLEKQRRDLEAKANQVLELSAEIARQSASLKEGLEKQRKLQDEITILKKSLTAMSDKLKESKWPERRNPLPPSSTMSVEDELLLDRLTKQAYRERACYRREGVECEFGKAPDSGCGHAHLSSHVWESIKARCDDK